MYNKNEMKDNNKARLIEFKLLNEDDNIKIENLLNLFFNYKLKLPKKIWYTQNNDKNYLIEFNDYNSVRVSCSFFIHCTDFYLCLLGH